MNTVNACNSLIANFVIKTSKNEEAELWQYLPSNISAHCGATRLNDGEKINTVPGRMLNFSCADR